ncbi:MAG: alcohol dehydrogenase catalytic domain-containing protein [Alphaproteobacteria bacterium]|nr:alcohol dehydrogenase catalytic domain-containing protein [Alphaproteobacteria bacterium]
MQAVVYDALGKATVRQIDAREPGPGEALVRTKASGICHTDIDILHGRYGNADFPIVPGHEYAGIVETVGAGVNDVQPGDRVVIDPNIGCGVCRPCRQGRINLCESLGAYGVTANGGFAEYSTVMTSHIVPIGEMPYEVAAFAEPMGCVLNGVEAVGADGVEKAIIFGAGPIGILIAMALRARNVSKVSLVDIEESRLELVESMGFTALASGSDGLAACKGKLDLAVDATGVPNVASGLIHYLDNGGKVLFFGVCPPDFRMEISPFEVFRRQLTLAGSHSLNCNIPEALDVLKIVGEDVKRLVSHSLPLAEIPRFLLGKAETSKLKVQAVM